MIKTSVGLSTLSDRENVNRLALTEKTLILITYILGLQILRNISTAIYIGVLFAFYFVLYGTFFYESKKRFGAIKINKLTGVKLIFLITYLMLPVLTLINSDLAMVAISRYLVTFPFIIFCFVYPFFGMSMINRILRVFVLISVLSAISIIVQIITGPISFFTDYSYREGLERYTSLSGSLTIFGTTGSMALLFVLVSKSEYSKFIRNSYIFLLIFGLLCSLQKSAIINIIIVLMIYLFLFLRISVPKFSFRSILFLLLIPLIIFSVFQLYKNFENSKVFEYVLATMDYTINNESSQYGVKQDLIARLTWRPLEMMNYHNVTFGKLISGVGLQALAGTMGVSAPMAHNNYVDLLVSGGVFHIITFLLLAIAMIRKIGSEIQFSFFASIVLLFLINMFIGAATFYQPVCCIAIAPLLFSNINQSDEVR